MPDCGFDSSQLSRTGDSAHNSVNERNRDLSPNALHRQVKAFVFEIKVWAATGSRIFRMKPIPWRVQLGAVAAGYAMVLLVAALLVYVRHIQYVNHPADVMSYGGMYAFGESSKRSRT